MKKKDKHQGIRWYLDFLSDHLDEIDAEDLERRFLEFKFAIHEGIAGLDTEDVAPRLEEVPASVLPKIRDAVDSNLAQRGIRISANAEKVLKEIQNALKPLVETMRMCETNRLGAQFISKVPANFLFVALLGPDGYRFRIIPSLDQKNLIDQAKILFIALARELPLGSIKVCQECKRYFLHLSERRKDYCSQPCAVRAITRRRREKDPDGYRKKQRELMRSRYYDRKLKMAGVSKDKA